MKRKALIILLLTLSIALLIVTQGYFTYSEGERGGYVRKLAKKGYVVKTFEGELVQQINGVLNAESFQFSVQDKKIVKELQTAMLNNERVNIKYKQKKYILQFLHGDTEYFIVAVDKSIEK